MKIEKKMIKLKKKKSEAPQSMSVILVEKGYPLLQPG